MRGIFSLFLLLAAWKDFKRRRIPIWLYVFFGVIGAGVKLFVSARSGQFCRPNQEWVWAVAAFLPGLLLLLLTKVSRGGVGAGDGWFFVTAAFYLGLWKTLALLFYGLLFCSLCSLGMITWGMMKGISVRKKRLPFLPFLIPAWLWIAWW